MKKTRQRTSDKRDIHKTSSSVPRSKVFSYYTAKHVDTDVLDMSRRRLKKGSVIKTAKMRTPLMRRLAVLVLVLIIGSLVTLLSNEPIINITGSSEVAQAERYAPGIRQYLQSSILNSNKLTLDDNGLSDYLRQTYPELVSTDVSTFVLGRKLQITLTVDNLPFLWESGISTYIVTESGVVAGERSELPDAKPLVIIKDESGISVKKGDKVLRRDDAEFINNIIKLVKEKGREVELIRLTTKPRELYVKPKDKPYEVKMYFDGDASQQVGSWFAAEEVLGQGGGAPQRYIDVRAGEKVFWQ